MKRKTRSLYDKLMYFINSIFALLLLLSYAIPYIKPESLGSFAGISLLTPFLILINLVFLAYWLIRLSRTFFLSLIVLAIGYPNLPRFFKITGKKVMMTEDVKVMSYNVRMFNKYNWIKEDAVQSKINAFIEKRAPDIICFQEYTANEVLRKEYPYSYIEYIRNNKLFGHAIFSKFRIVNKGSLAFKGTANNIIFADVLIDKDTVRVYNIHLQSLKINPNKDNFGEQDATKLRNRISTAFKAQQHQVTAYLEHQKLVNYPIIIAGDFNNTAYSWAYRTILKGKEDAFVAAGKGFDKTFDFAFPMRIDFIMLDKEVKINHFKTYRNKLSDHYPILARIERASLLHEKNKK